MKVNCFGYTNVSLGWDFVWDTLVWQLCILKKNNSFNSDEFKNKFSNWIDRLTIFSVCIYMFLWLRDGIRCFIYMLSSYDIHVIYTWHTLKHIYWDRHSLTKTYNFHHLPGSVWTKSRLRSLSWYTTCLRYQITECSFEKGFISYVYWNINRVINQTLVTVCHIFWKKNTCKISASPFVCVPFVVQFSVSHFSTMFSQTALEPPLWMAI